jgi:hypothetical protein
MEMLQSSPQMWMERGDEMGEPYANISRNRPDEREMFPHAWNPTDYADEDWTPESELGPFHDKLHYERHDETKPWGTGGFDFHDHDGNDGRGSVSQIDLVQRLMGLLGDDGRAHL